MIIGLTGGIGSGKSTVSAILKEEYGIPIVDADRISHKATEPGSRGLEAVAQVFGPDVLLADGRMDREAMRRRIAGDPDNKARLEAILHPIIQETVAAELAAYTAQGHPLVVYDCPLFFQTAQEKYVDRIMVVVAGRETRITRITARDGITRELAEQMLAIQMTDREMMERADIVIDNNGDEGDLKRCIGAVVKNLEKNREKQ